jgi:hypothetical protein
MASMRRMRWTTNWRGRFILFAVLAAAAAGSWACEESPLEWTALFQGVELTSAIRTAPDPLAVYAVRIDLQDRGVDFIVTPSNGDRPGETDSRTPSTFLEEFDCQVAINASPFSPVVMEERQPQDVVGLSVSRGDRYSEPHGDWDAVLISKDKKVAFLPQNSAVPETCNAAGGFHLILKDGQNTGALDEKHPRTAVGLSKDGNTLYLLVLDGRQEGYSLGATTAETADWMQRLGAYTALNLDGGGSTTLVIDDGTGRAKVVNRPVHGGIPNVQRPSANHLGVFAKGLEHSREEE